MSLYYRCDCCGATMHKLGENDRKRLHMDIGELSDYSFKSEDDTPCWGIDEYPLIQVDLCHTCYSAIVAKVRTLRRDNNITIDLKEVSIGGTSV